MDSEGLFLLSAVFIYESKQRMRCGFWSMVDVRVVRRRPLDPEGLVARFPC
jgi:hypothetical protein